MDLFRASLYGGRSDQGSDLSGLSGIQNADGQGTLPPSVDDTPEVFSDVLLDLEVRHAKEPLQKLDGKSEKAQKSLEAPCNEYFKTLDAFQRQMFLWTGHDTSKEVEATRDQIKNVRDEYVLVCEQRQWMEERQAGMDQAKEQLLNELQQMRSPSMCVIS